MVGLREHQLSLVRAAVESWIPSYLVKKEEIHFPVLSSSTGNQLVFNATMRIITSEVNAIVMENVFTENLNDFNKHMTLELMKEGCTSFKITQAPTLVKACPKQTYPYTVFIVIVVVCCLLSFISGYLVHKKCEKKSEKLLDTNV